jgi:hypothetical protein
MPKLTAMQDNNVNDRIRESIITSKQINIKMICGLTNEISIEFQPYIYGQDIMQFDFVWGYIPLNKVFYKIHLDNVASVQVTEITYTVLPDAVYLYSIEEEHYSVLVGFRNIFSQSCVPSSPENKAPESSDN